ncbi:serine hydrolase [Candidatus Kaiserbacteria bacterium]|nr:serine hydrolase [Candidatus Kaiserbacteria bacterium]
MQPPRLYGVASIFLMGIASFLFVVQFLDTTKQPPASQSATAAAAVADPFRDVVLTAKSAIVYDMKTHKVLFEKNADAQLPLASITKIMLTLAVAESLPLDTVVTIPYDTSPPGATERLAAGERWSVRDIINFTLIASSNEGANILAAAANDSVHAKFPASPAEDATIWRMNSLAQEIGMQHAYFLNANGLDLSVTQAGAYASARDVATMMAYAASTSPLLFSATTEDGLHLRGEDGDTTTAFNTNEALGDIPGLAMGKTGYTDLAGGNLTVVFDIGLDHPIAAVVLGSTHEGRFTDMKKIVPLARESVTGGR